MTVVRSLRTAVMAAMLTVFCSAGTAAQDSRADATAEAQAAKAAEVRPYQPSKAERIFVGVKRVLIDSPSGLYPLFGSVISGGGFAVGGGYRDFFGDRTFWDAKGLMSIRANKRVELTTVSPGHLQDRLDVFAHAGWLDATQVAFYGLGEDSPNSRSDFRMKESYVTGGLSARPIPFTVVEAALSYEDYSLEEGRGRAPSIEEIHTPQTAPGLGASPRYLHGFTSAGLDWRPAAGYARRGGLYQLGYHHYADRDRTYSFTRLDADLVQHVPLLRENWALSFRGRVQTTLDDQDVVPYFLLPSLGGGSTLRGYSTWRFRDRHSVLVSAEWRWMPNPLGFDMALFYDAGKVTAARSDLNLKNLKSDIGIGARFHSPTATPLRIELARGSEGIRIVFTSGAAF